MSQSYKHSFFVIVGLVFLLPIFFIPGTLLSIDSAKTALLIAGLCVAALLFLFESWRKGMVTIPKTWSLYFAALLPLVYLLSALLTTPSSLSLLGYNFEVGTFGSILLGSVLLVLSALIVTQSSRALQVLTALFAALIIVTLFSAVKISSGGNILVLGNFAGNMGNPL